jgi:hypothetical protein
LREIRNYDELKPYECPGRLKLKTGFKVKRYDLARKEDMDGKEMLEEEDFRKNERRTRERCTLSNLNA